MRDWLEQRVRRILRERAGEVDPPPFSLEQIRRRARRLALAYVVACLVLAGWLAVLVMID